jgi:regulatory protein YycH of two-component signal transduction system YycFG
MNTHFGFVYQCNERLEQTAFSRLVFYIAGTRYNFQILMRNYAKQTNMNKQKKNKHNARVPQINKHEHL